MWQGRSQRSTSWYQSTIPRGGSEESCTMKLARITWDALTIGSNNGAARGRLLECLLRWLLKKAWLVSTNRSKTLQKGGTRVTLSLFCSDLPFTTTVVAKARKCPSLSSSTTWSSSLRTGSKGIYHSKCNVLSRWKYVMRVKRGITNTAEHGGFYKD